MINQNIQASEAPLFEYLEEIKNEEFAIKVAKNKISSLRKSYLTNLSLSFAVIASICFMFYVQFKVDKLQNRVDLVQIHINDYKDELKLLAVEWSYLTRPDRIRFLSHKYLKKNKNITFAQVKNYDKLQKFYLAKLKKYEDRNLSKISQR